MNKPIVISMGEPSGISSEILIKTWINRKKKKLLPFFVVDDKSKIEFVINLFKFNAKIIRALFTASNINSYNGLFIFKFVCFTSEI